MKKRSSKKKSVKKKVVKTDNVCDQVCKNKILCWIPRVLAILFIVFISLFALDAFSEEGSFWQILLGFLIHLIPTVILVVLLVVAWRCQTVGGWLYLALGLVFTFYFDTYEHMITFFVVSGPLFLIGILFLISAMKNSKS